MKTFYSVQIIGRDGRFETKLSTVSVSRAEKEAARLASLNWDGRIVAQKTEKVLR